ncbi:hypothetical protein BCR34DRAFT_556031 [Clohesyomyces aquaticus]|uniref:Uncharacterized protein n=1 Tax=Clohesyomyces aquaticus TaxID=1231657 RepID=A0A1Y2A501_9PLEO|nr:hypothetical protein BCR34DRAFT_556031 [Clohesyomyces aquaticus]
MSAEILIPRALSLFPCVLIRFRPLSAAVLIPVARNFCHLPYFSYFNLPARSRDFHILVHSISLVAFSARFLILVALVGS